MRIQQLSVVTLVASAFAQCPEEGHNGGCCHTCENNRYCPANGGCFKAGSAGCAEELCPPPADAPEVTPAPTPATTPVPIPLTTPAPAPAPPTPDARCPREGHNGGCCHTCEYNRYCPTNGGCFNSGSRACPEELCPAPGDAPSPPPAPSLPTPPPPPVPPNVWPPAPPAPPSPAALPGDAHGVAAWLNELYTGFDENDDSSPLGVTMTFQNEFRLYCHTSCWDGHADCSLSTAIYNHKVMRRREAGTIAIFSERVAGFVLNQTRVENSLTKCSYMWDGAVYYRYHHACGCSSRSTACNDPTSAFGNVCPSTGETCTASDTEVSSCSCDNMGLTGRTDLPQCYFKGPAFEAGSEDQTRSMMKERIRLQANRANGDAHDPLEYWNEVIMDENVMIDQLTVDPAPVIPAFVYVKSNPAGLIGARIMRDQYLEQYPAAGAIPLIAIDDFMNVESANGQGPFSVESDEAAMQSVLV